MLVRRPFSWLIALVFSIFINLLFLNAVVADPLTIGGSSQMSTDGTQTLTATGGTGPYTWSVVAGGVGINPSTGAYTAPTSNPNCTANPTICVTDSTGQNSCMQIAVNGYSSTSVAATRVRTEYCECLGANSPIGCSNPTLYTPSNNLYLYCSADCSHYYNCAGTLIQTGWNAGTTRLVTNPYGLDVFCATYKGVNATIVVPEKFLTH